MSKRAAPRAVVDSNVFVSGLITPGGRPSRLLDLWYEGKFELLLSDQQYTELADVLGRPRIVRNHRIDPQSLSNLLAGLSEATRVVAKSGVPVPLRDSKDVHILAAAFGGAADYLVTGDTDLLVLQGDPRLGHLQIVTIPQFLAVLAQDTR